MSIQTINNGESGSTVRGKLNSNFAELAGAITPSGGNNTYARVFASTVDPDVHFSDYYSVANFNSSDGSPVNYDDHVWITGFLPLDTANLASVYTQFEDRFTNGLYASKGTEWHLITSGPGNPTVNRVLSAFMPYDQALRGVAGFSINVDEIYFSNWVGGPRIQWDLYNGVAQIEAGFVFAFNTNNVPVATQRNAAGNAQLNLPFFTSFDNMQAGAYCRLGPYIEGGTIYDFASQGTMVAGDKFMNCVSRTVTGYQWLGFFEGSTNGSSMFECYNSNATAGCRAIFVATANSTSGDAYVLAKDGAGTGFGFGYNGGDGRFEINSAADILGVAPYFTITHAAGVPANSTCRIYGTFQNGTHSALAGETVTGYITIKDSGGTTRKLAVVS